MKVEWQDLVPGLTFCFAAGRKYGLFRQEGVGRVLALDEAVGVVHIEVLQGDDSGQPIVMIGHMPFVFSALRRSMTSVNGVAGPRGVLSPSVQEWRTRQGRGEVGAFRTTVWNAIQLLYAVCDQTSFVDQSWDGMIECAFPKRDESGAFTVVEAVGLGEAAPRQADQSGEEPTR